MLIDVRNVSKSFKEIKIINNLSFKVRHGDFIGIYGKNGSGKTTLLKLILGILSPDSGEINIKSKSISYISCNHRSFYMQLSVCENLLFFMSINKKFEINKNLKKIESYLKKFEMLNLINTRVGELSTGQIKKLIFIRAFICAPEIVLMDEPLSNIDKNSQNTILAFIEEYFSSKNKAILWVTHNTHEASNFINKSLSLNDV